MSSILAVASFWILVAVFGLKGIIFWLLLVLLFTIVAVHIDDWRQKRE